MPIALPFLMPITIHLRWALISNIQEGQLHLHTAHQCCRKRVEELLGHFQRCTPTPGGSDLSSADAVFGFAFGYRMKEWPDKPTEMIASRTPGVNNAALAEQARQIHLAYKLPLYLQFEIADAIGGGTPVEYLSRRVDQGTSKVMEEFIGHANAKGKVFGSVVVVAHRHHYDRCRLLLKKERIGAKRPPELYAGYDQLEAQPRAMTPEDNIVNDFASMVGMA